MATKTNKIMITILVVAALLLTTYLLFTKQIMTAYYKLTAPKKDASDVYAPAENNSGSGGGKSNSPRELPNVDGADDAPLPVPNYKSANYSKMLKKGSKGNEVVILQIKMNDFLPSGNIQKLVADGDFGNDTAKALKHLTGYNTISLQGAIDYIKKKLSGSYFGEESNYFGGGNHWGAQRKICTCNR
jgi:hypothetical protein